jgi:hypothetical protein
MDLKCKKKVVSSKIQRKGETNLEVYVFTSITTNLLCYRRKYIYIYIETQRDGIH